MGGVSRRMMIVLVFTDLRERILPDVVNYTGFALGLMLQLVHQARGWHGAVDREAFVRLPSPGAGAFACGRAAGRGGRQRLAVAGLGSVFPIARARRHGVGRRKNDADGRRVSGRETHAADDPGGLAARQRAGGCDSFSARRKDSDYELPFGTFLGVAAMLVVFFGTPLVNWYQSLLMVR